MGRQTAEGRDHPRLWGKTYARHRCHAAGLPARDRDHGDAPACEIAFPRWVAVVSGETALKKTDASVPTASNRSSSSTDETKLCETSPSQSPDPDREHTEPRTAHGGATACGPAGRGVDEVRRNVPLRRGESVGKGASAAMKQRQNGLTGRISVDLEVISLGGAQYRGPLRVRSVTHLPGRGSVPLPLPPGGQFDTPVGAVVDTDRLVPHDRIAKELE